MIELSPQCENAGTVYRFLGIVRVFANQLEVTCSALDQGAPLGDAPSQQIHQADYL